MPGSPSSTALSSAYGQLLALLIESPNVDAFLSEAARLGADIVGAAEACGITFRRDGQPFTAAASGDLATQVDELQYETDEGPCLDALRLGEVVPVDDLVKDSRWPCYRPRAVAYGIASSLSVPLYVEGASVGALNLYGVKRHAFTPGDRHHAEAFAAQASAALTLTLRQARQLELQAQLEHALASRSLIDNAIGILMGQQRCDADAAFDLLRKASQHRNRKLRDIAAEIIVNVSGQAPSAPPAFRGKYQ